MNAQLYSEPLVPGVDPMPTGFLGDSEKFRALERLALTK